MKDSDVYVFRYSEDHTIVSERLEFYKRPKTASEVLNEVLGVPFTYPIWAEKELECIAKRFASRDLDEQTIKDLEHELSKTGLDEFLPKLLNRGPKQ